MGADPGRGSGGLDDILEHYGIKGMKWGVHKKSSSSSAPDSEDVAKVKAAKAKIKTGGTNTLSNKELKALVERMNLEQQYVKLSGSSKQNPAAKFVAELLLNFGKQQATKYVNDVLSKQLAEMVSKKKA